MYEDHSEEAVQSRSLGIMEKHLRGIVQRRCPAGSRFLEIGCGFGRFLKGLQDLPFELTAIELDESAAQYARQNVPGATILQESIESASFPPESQDVVAAIAVLEHVKDPRATLKKMTGRLTPGGALLIQVPYTVPYLKLKKWIPRLPIYLEEPRRLFDFSPKTLADYFRELAFEDVHIEVERPYSSNSVVGKMLIWIVKGIGLALHALSGGRYVYPYAGPL